MRKLITILLVVYFSPSVYATIPVEEREALISLYNQTGGSNWTSNSGWLGESGTECSWLGVSCLGGHVNRLDLNNRGLTGTIPRELVLLSNLKELDLSHNQLKGNIPYELGKIVTTSSITDLMPSQEEEPSIQLETLHLHNNQLTGTIPNNFRDLKILTLHRNKLEGFVIEGYNEGYTDYGCYFSEADFPTTPGLSYTICRSIFESPPASGLIGSSGGLHTLTLFDNCLTIDFSEIPLDLLNISAFDLGSQNSCSEEKNSNISLVKTTSDFEINIPSIHVNGQGYEVDLVRFKPAKLTGWYWRVNNISRVNNSIDLGDQASVIYDGSQLKFGKLYLGAEIIEATLHPYINPSDSDGLYFQYIP